MAREGAGKSPGKRGGVADTTGWSGLGHQGHWRPLWEGTREEEQVRRKMLRPVGLWGMCRGWHLGGGLGEHPPPRPTPNHTHLQLIGAAGTVLLYLHEHALLQLLQEGEEGLELGFQVLLHLGRVCLGETRWGQSGQDWPSCCSDGQQGPGSPRAGYLYSCPSPHPGGRGDFLTSTFSSICLRE